MLHVPADLGDNGDHRQHTPGGKMPRVDLVYSTLKGHSSLFPLFEHLRDRSWDVALTKVHKHGFRNRELLRRITDTVILAYDQPLYRLEKSGWSGRFIYIEHGLSPVKYYTYKYEFFHRAALLFYPGEVFQRKMKAVNPGFKHGLLGGYPKVDELLRMNVDREALCRELSLDSAAPVILFAPSWGGKRNKNAGVHNARHLQGIENLLVIPHSADYGHAGKYGAVIPEDGNINSYLRLADVVVSDVSSVLAEASILGKPVVQIRLTSYPGCFPEEDRRKQGIWISEEVLKKEEEQTDRSQRPFKIAYLDEDWDFGNSAPPEGLSEAVRRAVQSPDEYETTQRYWAEQSCWKADGKTCSRISAMIQRFLETGDLNQLD